MTNTNNIPLTEKKKVYIQTQQAFYVDFMPIVQKIQYNASIFNVFADKESQKHIIDEISKEVSKAIILLEQSKRLTDQMSEELKK